jgi:hypothetical protein
MATQGRHVSVPYPTCPQYHVRYHPEEEGRWALPQSEFGLDVIALIGTWRFREHRSVPEMHQRLQTRDLSISEREVTHLMQRYEELVTLRITDHERIKARLQKQGQVILAASMDCNLMSGTRCSGWSVIASRKRSS